MKSNRVFVLVVEDEVLTALSLGKLLSELGYDVCRTVTSAPDAVAAAASYRPDLILMDVHLAHGTDGIEAAQEIHDRFGIRSIFTTAENDPATRARAEAAEPLGFLIKPYTRGMVAGGLAEGLRRLKTA